MASLDTASASVPAALAPHLYLDPKVLALEDERIFSRTWQFAGHISQLPEPGTYLTANAGTQPVLVVRAMLQGVQRGDRQGGAAQQRVRRHVHDPLAAEPDLAPVAQRLDESGRGAKAHGGILRHRRQPPPLP